MALRRDIDCHFADSGHSGSLIWHYNFENVGKSPAFNIRLHLNLIKATSPYDRYGDFKLFVQRAKERAWMSGIPILYPGERTEFIRATEPNFNSAHIGAIQRDSSGRKRNIEVEGGKFGAFVCFTYFSEMSEP